jgi:hypothetical protein
VRPAARLSDIGKLLATEYSPLLLSFSGHTQRASVGGASAAAAAALLGGGSNAVPGAAAAAVPGAAAAVPGAAAPGAAAAAGDAPAAGAPAAATEAAPCFVNQICFELEPDDPSFAAATAAAAAAAAGGGRRPVPPQAEPSIDAMIRLLSPSLAPELKGILLNACGTEPMARLIQKDLPSLAIVCWRSIVEDKAAKAFSRGFYAAIAEGAPGAVSVHRAFDAGRAAFLRAGFSEGDPATYLHDRMHEHVRFRRFVPTCHGCKPPVHGQPVLVAKPRL